MNKGADVAWYLAIITAVLCSIVEAQAQELTPRPATVGQPGVTIEEVIITGSNIPTAEEVGPHPIEIYRRDDMTRLGVRSATDFAQKLSSVMGASLNENNVNGGDGRAEINLRGILAKE